MKLSDAEFVILRDLIAERIGLFYHPNKRDLLEDKLLSLVIDKGFNSFLDYYYLLKYDAMAAEEWKKVIDALRVPETFFGRERDQVDVLSEVLIPRYVAVYGAKSLKIWCAACSTGEEPLSIAMTLDRAGWFEQLPIEIVASDLSHSAIQKGRQGIYRPYSLRNFPTDLRNRYFIEHPGGLWKVAPHILSRIEWTTANITIQADCLSVGALSQFIFCRNVFIYFSEETIRRTVRHFFECMPIPSYLFVGASESLLKLTTDFELQEFNGAFIYVKR